MMVLTFIAAPATVHAGTVDWLLTPISGAAQHHISATAAWHGRLMVLAWAIIMPAALVVVRYFKITPRQRWPLQIDNPFWFISHRRLGYALVIIMTIALGLMLWGKGWRVAPFSNLHSFLGWATVVLAWSQIVGSHLRGTHGGPMDHPFTRQRKTPEKWPGDHFSMTRRRVVFEWVHKILGYLLIALAVVAIQTGLIAADAPVWMFLGIAAWWLVCLAVVLELQRRVGCIDTYQAIWGLDPTLPGYRYAPIGIGITRFTEANASDAPWRKTQRKKRNAAGGEA